MADEQNKVPVKAPAVKVSEQADNAEATRTPEAPPVPGRAPQTDVVRLDVPGDCTSIGIEGQVFAVVGGMVEVPLVLAAAARSYLEPLWQKLRDEAKRAEDAARAAAARAELPDFARGLLDRIEALEKEVLGR